MPNWFIPSPSTMVKTISLKKLMLKFNKGFPTNLKWHNLSNFFKCEVIFPGITDVGAGFEFIYLFIFNFHTF